jgi:hypothetical protein
MVRKAGSGLPYVKFYFKNVFINKLAWSGSGEAPNESVEFDFGGLVVIYYPQDSKTGAVDTGKGKTAGYDRQEGSADLAYKEPS